MYVHEGIEWSFHESMNKRIKIFTLYLASDSRSNVKV